MSQPHATGGANGSAAAVKTNGNVAASADPFYVFKECVSFVTRSTRSKETALLLLLAKDSPASLVLANVQRAGDEGLVCAPALRQVEEHFRGERVDGWEGAPSAHCSCVSCVLAYGV